MSGQYERRAAIIQWQAALVTLPTGTLSDTFTAAGVNTGMMSLTSFQGYTISLKLSEAGAVRGVSTSTGAVATAGDYPLEADVDYAFVVTPETRYLSVFGLGTAGTIYAAKTTTVGAAFDALGDPADAS